MAQSQSTKKPTLGEHLKDMTRNKVFLTTFFLRMGLAWVFLYAGIAAFLDPYSWMGFIPQFLRDIVAGKTLLFAHASVDIILGLWLLTDKKIFYASVLCALTLGTIVVVNLGALDVIFRDIGLLFAAIALAIISYRS